VKVAERLRAEIDGTSWIDWRGRCFKAAWMFQQVHPELILHHGTFVYGAHAWCEDDDGHVYDLTCVECWRLDDKSPPIAVDRAEDAMRFALEYEHYGPWSSEK
jgi:hypothetical protein